MGTATARITPGTPKIAIPAATPVTLERPDLDAVLDRLIEPTGASGSIRVALVRAPAGYGKTTLVSSWSRRLGERRGIPVAWMALGPDDDDPVVFHNSLVMSARRALLLDDGPLLLDLVTTPQPARRETTSGFVAAFCSALDATLAPDQGLCLVFDDVHLTSSPGTVGEISLLIRRLPERCRMLLSTRSEPRIPIQRLRLDGRLVEVGPDDLAFDRRLAASLFAAHGITLTPTQIDALHQRTDGWPAGLALAALHGANTITAATRNADAWIDEVSGTLPLVASYLFSDVVANFDPATLDILRATSIVDRFNGGLAERLSGDPRAPAIVARLEQERGLVVRVGPGMYRCNPLLREFLEAELERERPDTVPGLHRISALWCLNHGDAASALRHASLASDTGMLQSVVSAAGLSLIAGGGAAEVLDAARALPEKVAAARFAVAAAHLETGNIAGAEAWMRRLGDGRGDALRSILALRAAQLAGRAPHPSIPGTSSQPGTAIQLGDALTAYETLHANDAIGETGSLASFALVNHASCLRLLARLDEARAVAHQARVVSEASGDVPFTMQALALLSTIELDDGGITEANALALEAIDLARHAGVTNGWALSAAHANVALTSCLALDDTALSLHGPGAEASAHNDPDQANRLMALSFGPIARYVAGVHRGSAIIELRRIWDAACAVDPTPIRASAALVIPLIHRWAIDVGDAVTARRARTWLQTIVCDDADLAVLLAREEYIAGDVRAALALTKDVRNGSRSCTAASAAVEAHLLASLSLAERGNRFAAIEALHEGIARASRSGLRRTVVDAGRDLLDLIAREQGTFGDDEAFISSIREYDAARRGDEHPLIALSERERLVLRQLPTLRTIDEIAGELFVSVNTIKTQLGAIYRKLDASNRREAVTEARRRGLL